MLHSLALLPLLLSHTALADDYVMPPLPGICSGGSAVGVGCSFDGSKVDALAMTVAPKKSVIEVAWCPEECYATCPPSYPISADCEDCVFQHGDDCFRVPDNAAATDVPIQGGCFDSAVSDTTQEFDEMISKTTSHSGGFIFRHSSSTTVRKFYHERFEKNYSLALSYRYAISHAATLMPYGRYPKPSKEFELAALLLPAEYDEAAYREFVDIYGTHYMTQAYMGGAALLTTFFHSCFSDTFSEKEVSHASSSSFLGIFNRDEAHGWGSAIDKRLWETYSQADLHLWGGNASQYGELGVNNTMDEAQAAAWQASLSSERLVPLTFSLAPITDAMKGGWLPANVVANVNRTLHAYGAEVSQQMEDLAKKENDKDHYQKPSWCKWNDSRRRKIGQRRGRRLGGLGVGLGDTPLPSCPVLPPSPSAAAARFVEEEEEEKEGEKDLSMLTMAAADDTSCCTCLLGGGGSGCQIKCAQSGAACAVCVQWAGSDCPGKCGCGSPTPAPAPPSPGPKPRPTPRPGPGPGPPPSPSPPTPAPPTPSSLPPPLPGLLAARGDLGSLFGRGYDPSQLAVKGPVALWSYSGWDCDADGSCDNLFRGHNGAEFRRPDQVQVFDTPAAQSNNTNQFLLNSSDVKTWHWHHESEGINLGFFSFAHSESYSFVKEVIKSKTQVLTLKAHTEVAYQVDLWSPSILHCEMQPEGSCKAKAADGRTITGSGTQHGSTLAQLLASLPATCEAAADQAEYRAVTERFGTHYVASAVLGGTLNVVLAANQSLFHSMTVIEFQEQTSIAFNLVYVSLGFNSMHASETRDVKDEFRRNTEVVLLAYGGNPLYLEEDSSYGDWAASVPDSPSPIQTTFRNISSLLPWNSKQRECLAQDAATYLAEANASAASGGGNDDQVRCGDSPGLGKTKVPSPKSLSSPGVIRLGAVPTRAALLMQQQQKRRRKTAKTTADENDVPRRSLRHAPASRAVPEATTTAAARAEAQADAQTQAQTGCDPTQMVPGTGASGILGKTFDIKTGMARLPLGALTCDPDRRVFLPLLQKAFFLPTQVELADVASSCQDEQMWRIENETDAYRMTASAFGFNIGIGIGPLKIGLTFEKQMKELAEKMANFTTSMATLRRNYRLYKLSFASGASPVVSGELALALGNLPATYASAADKEAYQTFLTAAGTHYVAEADFGAHCEFNTTLNKTYESKMTSKFISEQFSLSLGLQLNGFGISVDLGFGTTDSSEKEDSTFRREARTNAQCVGGDDTLLRKTPPDYEGWVRSVLRAPQMVPGTVRLRPLSDLVLSGPNALKIRANLKQATLDYINNKKVLASTRLRMAGTRASSCPGAVPTCISEVPDCMKCAGGAHGSSVFCLQCCPGCTPVAKPPYTYCNCSRPAGASGRGLGAR